MTINAFPHGLHMLAIIAYQGLAVMDHIRSGAYWQTALSLYLYRYSSLIFCFQQYFNGKGGNTLFHDLHILATYANYTFLIRDFKDLMQKGSYCEAALSLYFVWVFFFCHQQYYNGKGGETHFHELHTPAKFATQAFDLRDMVDLMQNGSYCEAAVYLYNLLVFCYQEYYKCKLPLKGANTHFHGLHNLATFAKQAFDIRDIRDLMQNGSYCEAALFLYNMWVFYYQERISQW